MRAKRDPVVLFKDNGYLLLCGQRKLTAAREAGEDRSQGGQPWPVRHVPTGRGCRAEGTVPKNPEPDR